MSIHRSFQREPSLGRLPDTLRPLIIPSQLSEQCTGIMLAKGNEPANYYQVRANPDEIRSHPLD